MSAKATGQADFAVVGAGLAGLITASALREAHATVAVFEARERVGGRTVSASQAEAGDLEPPLVLDLGAQWVGPGQTESLQLIGDLGLHILATATPGQTTWALSGMPRQVSGSLPPMPPRAMADILVGGARLALMARRIPAEAPWLARNAVRWDRLTADDWIAKHLRTSAARAVAEIYIASNMAVEPEDTSLLNLLFALRSTSSLRDLARAEAFHVHEGAHAIADRLAERVREQIHLADPVRSISQDGGSVTVESDARIVRCRRVAVCVPPVLAGEIAYEPALAPRRAELLASLPMGSSVKFHAVYPRPFWRSSGSNGQALSASHTVCLTYDNSPEDGSGRGVLVGLVVADHARRLSGMDRSSQQGEILASLADLFGPKALAPDVLVLRDWSREQWTRGCYAAHFPRNAWTTFGSAFRAPCGRIHWAGTETATEWHGYMEGAIRSGRRAAREMLQLDGVGRSR